MVEARRSENLYPYNLFDGEFVLVADHARNSNHLQFAPQEFF